MQGKVIAITGASSGIGEAAARRLAAGGAKLVLGARRGERLEALARELGPDAVAQPTDVTRREDLAALVGVARERFGRLDVLVANAGVAPIGPLSDLAQDDWERMVDVNLKGVLHGIGAALPVFAEQGRGHFVTTASTSAHRVTASQSVYAATKIGVRALLEGLRQESPGAPRVTVISPGMTRTALADGADDPRVAEMMAIAMDPDAVARAIAYAIAEPDDVEVGEVIIRPTAQQ